MLHPAGLAGCGLYIFRTLGYKTRHPFFVCLESAVINTDGAFVVQ